jgi:hypothetical protein
VLAEAGFDLVHEFDSAVLARDRELAPIIDPERRRGVLVANTRALWPRFIAAYRADRELQAASDPLDLYVERTLARAFPGERVYFVHAQYAGAWLPFQRLAQLAGFAHLAPTHLVIHPIYGPWIALRGLVTLAGEPPVTRALAPPCTCDERCLGAVERGDWLAARDACPVGREHRYGETQLAYHYSKDRSLL